MTVSYVTAKVKEALEATGNNKRDAQKLLVTWAVRDQQLLLGLAKPHLKDLVEAKLDTIAKKQKKDSGILSKNEIETIAKEHGTENEKRKYSKVPPPKSSKRQANVMRKLAEAFRKK